MRKIFVVASTEFANAVRTKAFVIGVLMLPLIMVGSILVQKLANDQVDTKPKPFAILDGTGKLAPGIVEMARLRNDMLDPAQSGKAQGKSAGQVRGARFEPTIVAVDNATLDAKRLELSDQIRDGKLFAFVEIPAGVIDPASDEKMIYHSNEPSANDLSNWLQATVGAQVQGLRFSDAKLDPTLVARINRPIPLDQRGLVQRGADGGVGQAAQVDKIRLIAAPAALMFLLFMVVMSSAPQMLNSVLEEKMSRISEVLLGSVTPFELMMGKLIGGAGVSLVLAALYVGGGYGVAWYYGYSDAISPGLFASFVLFMVMAVVLYGSLYLAVGASCSELKDAQTLMMPVMLVSMFPIFVWTAILQAPSSTFSVVTSMIPFATPYLMLLRMGLQPTPPAWQVGVSIVLTLATTVGCVWAAGKIFRTGLLMHGKAPSLLEMARWVTAR
ncbi:ABC transporter permease [Isosphaeraceae bacterium EP7]